MRILSYKMSISPQKTSPKITLRTVEITSLTRAFINTVQEISVLFLVILAAYATDFGEVD